jgi:hypothetical protein
MTPTGPTHAAGQAHADTIMSAHSIKSCCRTAHTAAAQAQSAQGPLTAGHAHMLATQPLQAKPALRQRRVCCTSFWGLL